MRITPINTSSNNSTTFGSKISPKLRKILMSEATQRGNKDKVKYAISQVEKWGSQNVLLDTIYSPSNALNYITIKNPKMSKRVYLSLTYGESVSGAFGVLSEKLIKQTEKLLFDTICQIDN